jgi:hypothetical protein
MLRIRLNSLCDSAMPLEETRTSGTTAEAQHRKRHPRLSWPRLTEARSIQSHYIKGQTKSLDLPWNAEVGATMDVTRTYAALMITEVKAATTTDMRWSKRQCWARGLTGMTLPTAIFQQERATHLCVLRVWARETAHTSERLAHTYNTANSENK